MRNEGKQIGYKFRAESVRGGQVQALRSAS